MFKIYHFANSFVSVEAKNSIITCDPWVGKTNDNGWFSYPIKNTKEIEKKIFNSNFVYITLFRRNICSKSRIFSCTFYIYNFLDKNIK